MPRSMFRVLAVGSVGVMVAVSACLGALPEAMQCPPAPVYAPCRLYDVATPESSPPRPPTEGPSAPVPTASDDGGPSRTGEAGAASPAPAESCAVDFSRCSQQGRVCACIAEEECGPSEAACTPAPDCPRSVRGIDGAALCLATRATFLETASDCTCGCASCASACDGRGPILGPGQRLHFELPSDLPTSGRLGVMARLRGGGRVLLAVWQEPVAGVFAVGEVLSGIEYSDAIAHNPGGALAEYEWNSPALAPTAVELRADSSGAVEVDCVVPFVSR